MKTNILFCGFNGKCNTSKLLLDSICGSHIDKLYLKNSFKSSYKQLYLKLLKNDYDYIFMFGEWKIVKGNTIRIEQQAKMGNVSFKTNIDTVRLSNLLIKNGFNVTLSRNAGDYLCNYIYYYGLKFIYEKNKRTKIIFLHLPKYKNRPNISKLAILFSIVAKRLYEKNYQ